MERNLPALYLAIALLITLLLTVLTAPFFGPDEANQACRAISLGHGAVIARMGSDGGPEEAGGQIDAGVLEAMEGVNNLRMAWERQSPDFHDRHYGPFTAESERQLSGIRWARRTVFVPFGNTAVYPPVLYVPAILGWRMGEAANLTIFNSLRLARLFSALTAVALGWLALRIAAGWRWRLLPFLLLPSTLFLNASCSQDAALLSVAALAVALLGRALEQRRQWDTLELVLMAGLLALCGSARPPNMGLAVVLFVPAMEAAGTSGRRWIGPAIAFSGVLAVCGVWIRLMAPLGMQWSDEADPEMQGIFVRAHPVAALWAIVRGTGGAAFDFFHRGLYVIGWNDLLPHHGAAALLSVCLAVVALTAPGFPVRTMRGRLLLGLAVAGPLLGISLAEYVIWTPPGFGTVYGIQPRYWLPMLPLAMMLVPRVRWGGGTRTPPQTMGPFEMGHPALSGVLAVVACTLPWMAAHAFYREGVLQVLRMNLRY